MTTDTKVVVDRAVESTPEAGGVRKTAPAAPRAPSARLLGQSLLILAAFCLGFVLFVTALSALQHRRMQDTLYASFRGQLSQATAPVTAPIREGAPVAVLQIPRLALREVVVEGTSGGDLTNGPGHRRDTVLPGQAGICIIMGRHTAFGGPFGRLGSLRPGDEIAVTTGQGKSRFRVLEVRDSRAPVSSATLAITRLNLMTAGSSWSPTHSIVVSARLETAPLPAGVPAPTVRSDEAPLASDSGSAVALLLWSQCQLLALATTTYAGHRWTRWQVHVAAVPALAAVLWNVYENLAHLLPNTL